MRKTHIFLDNRTHTYLLHVQQFSSSSSFFFFFFNICPFSWQPAFYEAFGLTVVEAMTCGLPTFATCHGGPAEIIEHGVSGFHIDPYHPDQVSTLLVEFFERSQKEPSYWNKISDGGLKRIHERYEIARPA